MKGRLRLGTPKDDALERERTLESVRAFVNARALKVQRFIAAFPLLLQVRDQIRATHTAYKEGERSNKKFQGKNK
jgi:hypothetical protein